MKRINKVVKDKGITQTWFTEKLGESFNMANVYVQNRHQPSLETLNKIAALLEIDIKELLNSSKQ